MNTNSNIRQSTRRAAFFGIMLAIVTVLSFIENTLPPIPFMPPNVRLGLSNIVTMYCLFFIGKKDALLLALLKSTFVLLTRGAVAGIMSFSGGLLSILVIIALMFIFRNCFSYMLLSVCGAIFHNMGQITAASLLLQYNLVLYYIPISIIGGVVMGMVTGILLRVTIPLFDRIK